ncbi:hypothetical protein EVB27_069 [Rhizobium phage RHph_TM16]|nr:hypothetical protein EVB27_069 [Rhizobium phage RHph_TM16]
MHRIALAAALGTVAALVLFTPVKADEKDGIGMVCASAGEIERGDYSMCHRLEPGKYVTLSLGLCKMTDNQARVCDMDGKNCYGGFVRQQWPN